MEKNPIRNYGISIFGIIVITVIILVAILPRSTENSIPHINVTINDENNSIYLYLQEYYDQYYSEAISTIVLDNGEKVEIYLASYIKDGVEYQEYLYYCPTIEDGVDVCFSLYRASEKIDYFCVSPENGPIGTITFEDSSISEEDTVKVTIKKDDMSENDIIELNQ